MYNPYSVTFPAAPPNSNPTYLNKSGELFVLHYKGDRISDGRQPRALAIQICDLLNDAFNNGVNDVKAQLDPILEEYKDQLEQKQFALRTMARRHGIVPVPDTDEDSGLIDDDITIKPVVEQQDDKPSSTSLSRPRRVNKYIDPAD